MTRKLLAPIMVPALLPGPSTPEEFADARTSTGIRSLFTAPIRLVPGFLDFISSLLPGATAPG